MTLIMPKEIDTAMRVLRVIQTLVTIGLLEYQSMNYRIGSLIIKYNQKYYSFLFMMI